MSAPPADIEGLGDGSMPPGLGEIPAVDNRLGALLIGNFFAVALWGLACAQTWSVYNRKEAKDTWMTKTLLACLLLVDTLHSIVLCHVSYTYLVTNYLNPEASLQLTWSVCALVILVSLCDFIIRGLFCQRIYRFSGNKLWIVAPIMVVSLADFIVGTTIFAKALGLHSYAELGKVQNLFYVNFATGVTSDLGVGLAMCALLARSRTGYLRTDSLITKLIVYTVNSSLIVAVDAVLGMATYIAMPNNFIFLTFYCIMSKLYLNSYLALLNARDDLRVKVNQDIISTSIHLTSMFRQHQLESVDDRNQADVQSSGDVLGSRRGGNSELSATVVGSEKGLTHSPPQSPMVPLHQRVGSAGSTHTTASSKSKKHQQQLEVNIHRTVSTKRDTYSAVTPEATTESFKEKGLGWP